MKTQRTHMTHGIFQYFQSKLELSLHEMFVNETVGGTHHKGANVTKNVKVEPEWKSPEERQEARARQNLAKHKADKEKSKKDVTEAGMGGINRCAPAQDVSYQNVLKDVTDKWRGQTVTVKEMNVDTLQDYVHKAKQVDPATTPKYKMVKHAEGHNTANKKIAQKTGDRTKTYEERLQYFVGL